MTVCKQDGYFTFATDDADNLEHIINQALSKDLLPIMLIDQEPDESSQKLAALTSSLLSNHPDLAVFHILDAPDFVSISDAMRSGARAVLPKPDTRNRNSTFVDDSIYFLETLRRCIKITPSMAITGTPQMFLEAIDNVSGQQDLHEIARVADCYLSNLLGRAATFFSRKSEFYCEHISRQGSSQPLSISISIDGDSALHKAFKKGEIVYDNSNDPLIQESLYQAVGQPLASQFLLAPLKCLGRVIAVTYADFGAKQPTKLQLELVSTLYRYAGIVYENALYRKKFEKMLQDRQ
jgi:hypothetical protein